MGGVRSDNDWRRSTTATTPTSERPGGGIYGALQAPGGGTAVGGPSWNDLLLLKPTAARSHVRRAHATGSFPTDGTTNWTPPNSLSDMWYSGSQPVLHNLPGTRIGTTGETGSE
jgi:hypothetical protein